LIARCQGTPASLPSVPWESPPVSDQRSPCDKMTVAYSINSSARATSHRVLDSIMIVTAFRFQKPLLNELVDFRFV
jgi:hypothetical protein